MQNEYPVGVVGEIGEPPFFKWVIGRVSIRDQGNCLEQPTDLCLTSYIYYPVCCIKDVG